MEVPITAGLLRSIDAYESKHGVGPMLDELAADIGIPPEFTQFLDKLLSRELAAGRVMVAGGRYRLTGVGRTRLTGEAVVPRPTA